jgi:hypothetical protein
MGKFDSKLKREIIMSAFKVLVNNYCFKNTC